MTDPHASLRAHLSDLLLRGNAHLDFDSAVAGVAVSQRGARPSGVPHSPWRLIEHLRIAQWDILEFCGDPNHVSPDFPHGYWPEGDAPPDDLAWNRTLAAFRADRGCVLRDGLRQPSRAKPDGLNPPDVSLVGFSFDLG